MKILVLNSGSSSIKFKMYNAAGGADNFVALCEGQADRVGIDGSTLSYKPAGADKKSVQTIDLKDHEVAINAILKQLTDAENGVLTGLDELGAVGHRVVHGGEDFTSSVVVTDEVMDAIDRNSALAPLHNPPNLMGIKAMSQLLPEMPQVAVFDTAVHQTMPKKAFMYALPQEQYTEHKIRKYGFHGTSHGFVAKKAADVLGKDLKDLKIVTCHIGNGGSLAAFLDGNSVDTSMGFTPLDGIIMGTRCGTIDPYVPLFIMESQGLSTAEVSNMMNKQGGLLGISGNSDMRDCVDGAAAGDEACQDAVEMFCYSIQKYIGAYVAAMNGVDAIVFTAGVGENNSMLRERILSNFTYLGLELDKAKNDAHEAILTTAESKVAALRIETNEELVIALDAFNLVNK